MNGFISCRIDTVVQPLFQICFSRSTLNFPHFKSIQKNFIWRLPGGRILYR